MKPDKRATKASKAKGSAPKASKPRMQRVKSYSRKRATKNIGKATNPWDATATLYGKEAAHLADVCGMIASLALRPPHPEDTARRMHEQLGAWLATATPADLRRLARWRDRPDWQDPEDPMNFGIQLEVFDRCVQQAASKAGGAAAFWELDEAQRQRLLREALSLENKREVLRQIPREELRDKIKMAQMGDHDPQTVRKSVARRFKAARAMPRRSAE